VVDLIKLSDPNLIQRPRRLHIPIAILVLYVAGNTKGGSIIVPLTSCLTCLDYPVLQIKTKIVSCHTAYSKQVKLEVNGAVISTSPFSIP
jgi:hypothetical protein